VEEQLRTLGAPRSALLALPAEGRLSPDEQPVEQLHGTLAALGPVFADFGRYLSSRVDLLPRRLCDYLGERVRIASPQPGFSPDAVHDMNGPLGRRFFKFDPEPRAVTGWTQQHYALLAPNMPATVTIVRPDAERILESDLPLLSQLGPWLGVSPDALTAPIDDFSRTLRLRLDQTHQADSLITLGEDARAGGGFDAPVCYRDFSAPSVLTTERIDGVTAAHTTDRESVAERLASAWLRQALNGRVVPFDFDLDDVRLHDGHLVMVGGAFEKQTAAEREQFLRYLITVAADDPDAAWIWLADATVPGPQGHSEYHLRRRLRQAVPFRDGGWSGDDRIAEQLMVQWRVTREAGWDMRSHPLHLYRGIHAIATATSRLAPDEDTLLAALRDERSRRQIAGARQALDPQAIPYGLDKVVRTLVQLPQMLDEVLTLAASGRLRVKLHVPDAEEGRRARNRTVSFVASLVTLVGIAVLVRHLAPEYGDNVERIGAILLLLVGGWLLVAAARL